MENDILVDESTDLDELVDLEEAAAQAQIQADNAEAVMLAWNGDASRFTDEQYRKSCLIVNGNTKDQMHLPVRDPGGAINCDGVSAAASRVGQVSVSPEQKKSAAKRIASLMRNTCKKEPPAALLKLAGSSSGDSSSNSGSSSNSKSGGSSNSASGSKNLGERIKGWFAPVSHAHSGEASPEPLFQMPINLSAPVELGPNKFKKRLFPVGRETHYTDPVTGEERVLDFSAPTLSKLRDNVKAKAFDVIPLLDRHTDKQDATYLGKLVDAELDSEWFYGVFETTDEGAKRVQECPDLPTSAGYLEDYTRNGDKTHFGPTLQHVATVWKPQVHGLGTWSAVELDSGESITEVDLRGAEFTVPKDRKESGSVVTETPENPKGGEVEESASTVVLSDEVTRAIQLAVAERDQQIEDLKGTITQLSESNQENTRARLERDVDYRLDTEYKTVNKPLREKARRILLSEVANTQVSYVQLEQNAEGQPVAAQKQSPLAEQMWSMLDDAKGNPNLSVKLGESGSDDIDPDLSGKDDADVIRLRAKEKNISTELAEEQLIAEGVVSF